MTIIKNLFTIIEPNLTNLNIQLQNEVLISIKAINTFCLHPANKMVLHFKYQREAVGTQFPMHSP